ncbi:NADH-quinone oxidoreductase subunit L [Alteromonas sp. BMJM2]|uniref:NADH-quinone oxidoreductase subunit L n=1 Tax=Alteromonas sp. BMJM2 TaxID=2954241 RepID=UPI0022B482C1|nr:NADH-quinone oxidoreductase subunit L [Alteromonas sp. BMJM2]
MSPQTSAFLLISLPLFWAILSWFSSKKATLFSTVNIEEVAIVGSITLLVVSLVTGLSSSMLTDEGTTAVGVMLVSISPMKAIVMLTVVAIGTILMRFSRNYLVGEACYPRFLRWMQLTLSSVVITILANHLIIFWAGWLAVSLSLHNLLLLYPERPRAIIAAHKKFILARTSECLMAGAFVLLFLTFDTLYIDEILYLVNEASQLSQSQSTFTNTQLTNTHLTNTHLTTYAACLISAAALLKCAQLPAHGWLINIVEAPTPVSALLHAGVINLGGYLLLAFAPLIAVSPPAQWMLLAVAGLSVFFSALIMTTRVTIKVRLAWSTSSQMGLMLIECAMGLYSLALIHLVAHSFYKAYAFLNTGSAVYETLEHNISAHRAPLYADWLNAAFITSLTIAASFSLSSYQGPASPWVLMALAFTSFLAMRTANSDQTQMYILVAITIALVSFYATIKGIIQSYIVPAYPAPIGMFSLMDIWVSALLVTLFALHFAMQTFASHILVKRFKQLLFAGFYLDEWFTKVTLKLYPIPLRERKTQGNHVASVSKIGSK